MIFMRSRTKLNEPAKKARGRPRAYDPETALRQAAATFWKAGYAGTSLDDIAAATGMNRPSLNAAFGDKHAIYIKALSAYWDFKFASIRKAFGSGGTLAESLIKVYDAALSIYFTDDGPALGCFVVGTAVTEAPLDEEIRTMTAEGFRKLDSDFEARFKLALDAGELNKDADPKTLAMLATATMHSMAIRDRSGSSRNELRKFAKKVVGAICG